MGLLCKDSHTFYRFYVHEQWFEPIDLIYFWSTLDKASVYLKQCDVKKQESNMTVDCLRIVWILLYWLTLEWIHPNEEEYMPIIIHRWPSDILIVINTVVIGCIVCAFCEDLSNLSLDSFNVISYRHVVAKLLLYFLRYLFFCFSSLSLVCLFLQAGILLFCIIHYSINWLFLLIFAFYLFP